MYCRRMRDDDHYWKQIEQYLADATGQEVSHGICPDCYESVVRPQLAEFRKSVG